jgi:hypothetical protein
MAEPAQRVVPAAEPVARRRRLAIVPAYNEEHTIERVSEEIRSFDPGFAIVVVDDGSIDLLPSSPSARARKQRR